MLKTQSIVTPERINRGIQARFNPIRGLTPESLSRQLDEFHAGNFRVIGQTWESIERRDDVLQGVASKRKKAVARLDWEIATIDDSPQAQAQRAALEYFYNNLNATNAIDQNQSGGIAMLVEQMMDAIGKRYATHEIVWQPLTNSELEIENQDGKPQIPNQQSYLTAQFRFVPIWFFENRTGRLRYIDNPSAIEGIDMPEGQWMITVGEGLMESCSVAYMYKHLPLRDWLIYSERNGMPGVRGVTDALPGSREWELAREAVENFGSEFSALMNRGTEIEAIDLSSRGDLPYAALVERMDRAMVALWRGADLSTFSARGGVGASVQQSETALLEEHDARMIAETLNAQVDRHVIHHLFGNVSPRAYFHIKTDSRKDIAQDLKIYRELWEMGAPIGIDQLMEHFGIPKPRENEPIITTAPTLPPGTHDA